MTIDHRLVFCSCPDRETALRLADALVGERLAACISVTSPVTSVYRWQGKVEHEDEVLLLAKTAGQRWPALVSRLAELHPYEVPEIIAIPLSEGLPSYLSWIDECTMESTS